MIGPISFGQIARLEQGQDPDAPAATRLYRELRQRMNTKLTSIGSVQELMEALEHFRNEHRSNNTSTFVIGFMGSQENCRLRLAATGRSKLIHDTFILS